MVELTCGYCGGGYELTQAQFDRSPAHATQPVCISCYYAGRTIEEKYPEIMGTLRERVTANAGIWHSGGGTFHFWIPVDEDGEKYILINDGECEMPEEDDHPGATYVAGYFDDKAMEGEDIVLAGMNWDGTGIDAVDLAGIVAVCRGVIVLDELAHHPHYAPKFGGWSGKWGEIGETFGVDANELFRPGYWVDLDSDGWIEECNGIAAAVERLAGRWLEMYGAGEGTEG